jgi:pilus assembly protein FimV
LLPDDESDSEEPATVEEFSEAEIADALSDELLPEEDDLNTFVSDDLTHDDLEFSSSHDDNMTEEDLAAFIEAESAENLEETPTEFQLGDDPNDEEPRFTAVDADDEPEPSLESLQQNSQFLIEDEDAFAELDTEMETLPDFDETELNDASALDSETEIASADEDDLDKLLSQLSDGDLDDFDSSDTEFDSVDEINGKFDLAQMYLDMQDNETARSILNEILEEGDSEQQRKAKALMAELA